MKVSSKYMAIENITPGSKWERGYKNVDLKNSHNLEFESYVLLGGNF